MNDEKTTNEKHFGVMILHQEPRSDGVISRWMRWYNVARDRNLQDIEV